MSETPDKPAPSTPPATAPRTGRGWRRARRGLIVFLSLVVVGVLVITRTGVVGSLVLSRLESELGCIASASGTRVTIDGRVIVSDLELRAQGIDGPAAMFFQAPELTIEPVWLSLLSSSPQIDRVVLRQPVVRICQDDALRLNVSSLATGGAGAGITPTVDVENGVIEFGEFGPGWYTPLTSLRVQGKLARVAPNSSRYIVQLVEAQRQGPGGMIDGLHLDGEFDLVDLSAAVRLGNVDFARFRDTPAPSRIEPLWRQLALAGSLRDTEFTYSPATGVNAIFRLESVDLNIPIPADRSEPIEGAPPPATTELLRMRGVSGVIRLDNIGLHADLTGTIEDLGCHVSLETEGYTLDAALVCRIRADEFRVAERPRLLPFAPFIVKRNFQRFSGPTALVTGDIEIRRGPAVDGGPGAIAANGQISFSEGSARFEKFLYPFVNMAGTVRFDETKVVIERITGVGPTGAKLLATGLVAPPVETAGVHVDIVVTDAPADDVLYEAIPEHRRSMYNALFSREEYVKLLAAGVVQSAESQRATVARRAELERQIERLRYEPQSEEAIAGATAEIAELDRKLTAPVFELAGPCQIRVEVDRKEGPDQEYETSILVSLPRAGLLPEAFPYPVVAQNFTLKIDDLHAVAEAPMLRSPSGASGSMQAFIEFMSEGPDDFDIQVSASGVKVDPALLAALDRRDRPRAGQATPAKEGETAVWSAARLVRALDVQGQASCDARIVSKQQGTLSYTIDVAFSDVRAQPGSADLMLSAIEGRLAITEQEVHVKDLRGLIGDGQFAADLSASGFASGQNAAPTISGTVQMTELELRESFERVIEAFSPQHAVALAELRKQYQPFGQIDASISIGMSGAGLQYRVDLEKPRAVGFNVMGGKMAISDSTGALSIGHDALRCDEFSAAIEFENEPAGELQLDGLWPLSTDGESIGQLEIELRGGQFASPIVRSFAASLDRGAIEWLEAVELRGAFDASGTAHRTKEGRAYFTGALSPRSISVARRGVRTTFDEVQGSITFGPDGGRIESLAGACPDWSFAVEGTWMRHPSPAADLNLSIESMGLKESLLALLPEAVGRTRDSIGLRVDGPLNIRDAHLRMDSAPGESLLALDLALQAEFERAAVDPGFILSVDRGVAHVAIQLQDFQSAPALDISLSAPACDAAGIELTHSAIRIRSGDDDSVYVFEGGRAAAHGGELAVEGSVRVSPEPGQSAYELELSAAGVDFASLRAALVKQPAKGDAPPVDSPGPEPSHQETGDQGVLDAYIGLAGPMADVSARRGAGIIRVQGGEVIALPGLTGLLRLSNLQAPIGEVLDHASALFNIVGQEVRFEKVEAGSESFVIVGEGTMQWPSTDLNLTFNTRGTSGVPILSDLFRGLRDEIVTTEMTGTLREPEFRMVQLPATRRMLGTIFRGEPQNQPPEATKADGPSHGSNQEAAQDE